MNNSTIRLNQFRGLSATHSDTLFAEPRKESLYHSPNMPRESLFILISPERSYQTHRARSPRAAGDKIWEGSPLNQQLSASPLKNVWVNCSIDSRSIPLDAILSSSGHAQTTSHQASSNSSSKSKGSPLREGLGTELESGAGNVRIMPPALKTFAIGALNKKPAQLIVINLDEEDKAGVANMLNFLQSDDANVNDGNSSAHRSQQSRSANKVNEFYGEEGSDGSTRHAGIYIDDAIYDSLGDDAQKLREAVATIQTLAEKFTLKLEILAKNESLNATEDGADSQYRSAERAATYASAKSDLSKISERTLEESDTSMQAPLSMKGVIATEYSKPGEEGNEQLAKDGSMGSLGSVAQPKNQGVQKIMICLEDSDSEDDAQAVSQGASMSRQVDKSLSFEEGSGIVGSTNSKNLPSPIDNFYGSGQVKVDPNVFSFSIEPRGAIAPGRAGIHCQKNLIIKKQIYQNNKREITKINLPEGDDQQAYVSLVTAPLKTVKVTQSVEKVNGKARQGRGVYENRDRVNAGSKYDPRQKDIIAKLNEKATATKRPDGKIFAMPTGKPNRQGAGMNSEKMEVKKFPAESKLSLKVTTVRGGVMPKQRVENSRIDRPLPKKDGVNVAKDANAEKRRRLAKILKPKVPAQPKAKNYVPILSRNSKVKLGESSIYESASGSYSDKDTVSAAVLSQHSQHQSLKDGASEYFQLQDRSSGKANTSMKLEKSSIGDML